MYTLRGWLVLGVGLAIARAWQLTLFIARKRGSALAIAHPYPETLALLETELSRLKSAGVRLVPPSELIGARGRTQPRTLNQLKLTSTLTIAMLTTDRVRPAPRTTGAAGATKSRP